MATTETSTNGFTNGAKAQTNGANGVAHHGGGGGGDHEEVQYLDLIRRIIETGERLRASVAGSGVLRISISQERRETTGRAPGLSQPSELR